jgi:hypothetical protein
MTLAAGYYTLFPKSPDCHQVILPSSLPKKKRPGQFWSHITVIVGTIWDAYHNISPIGTPRHTSQFAIICPKGVQKSVPRPRKYMNENAKLAKKDKVCTTYRSVV